MSDLGDENARAKGAGMDVEAAGVDSGRRPER